MNHFREKPDTTIPKPAGRDDFLTGLVVLLAICFLYFIYAPFEMLFSNQGDLWFDLYTLLPVALLLFGVLLLAGSALLFLLQRIGTKWCVTAVLLCFSCLLCLYVQGNFMAGNLPPLDGTDIDWNDFLGGRIASLLLWIGGPVGVFALSRRIPWQRFRKAVKAVSLFIFFMLTLSLVLNGFLSKGYVKKTTWLATTKNELELSEDTNFLILILDALDAGDFGRLLEENPEQEEIFRDFTYYENVLAAYPFTKHSIPFILSGDWYENDEPFEDYLAETMKESTFLNSLTERGYRMGLYDTENLNYLTADGSQKRFENIAVSDDGTSSQIGFAVAMVELAGVKYAPFELKRLCYEAPERIRSLRQTESDLDAPLFSWSNSLFYQMLQEEELTLVPDKCFRFIHIEGAHVPFRYDKDMNVVEGGTSYKDSVEASMTIAGAYLDKLKEAGVYENSVIIIMGDHGYDAETNTILGRMNPVVLIKGLHESHELQRSDAPISYADLQDAYLGLLEGEDSGSIFAWKPGETRNRRCLVYAYEEDEHMEEYVQTGRAKDSSTLVATGAVYDLEAGEQSSWRQQAYQAAAVKKRLLYPDDVHNRSSIDQIALEDGNLYIGGWALIDGLKCDVQQVYVELTDEKGGVTQWTASSAYRFDIADWLGSNYCYSGYDTNIPAKKVKDGVYTVRIIVKNAETIQASVPYRITKENETVSLMKN